MRWMVIARKVWGGNRTWAGARTQQILMSVLRTCWQQDKDPFARLISLQCFPRGTILDIVAAAGLTASVPTPRRPHSSQRGIATVLLVNKYGHGFFAGLAPNAIGLYQFNVVVPKGPFGGFSLLTFMPGGVAGNQTFSAVQ